MSRSRKTNPGFSDGEGSRRKSAMKKLANSKVRKSDVSDGKAYKKVFNSWDIQDYNFRQFSNVGNRYVNFNTENYKPRIK